MLNYNENRRITTMGYYKIKSHAGTGKLLNIAASGPISGRKNTNIWDESCPIDQTLVDCVSWEQSAS